MRLRIIEQNGRKNSKVKEDTTTTLEYFALLYILGTCPFRPRFMRDIMMKSTFVQTLLPRIKLFFEDKIPRQQKYRSRGGLLLALVLMPFLLGILACLPVPTGNPEKSRIDPTMSGIWIGYSEGDATLLVLDPYDKRTWLISYFNFSTTPDSDSKASDESAGDSSAEGFSNIELLRKNRLEIESVGIYKGWLTKIKSERFINWESKTLTNTLPDMVPEAWWVFRVRQGSDGIMRFDLIDPDHEEFDDFKTRSQAEKFIRRHMNDPEFFIDDDGSLLFGRLSKGDYEAASGLIEDFGVLVPFLESF
jgi:hypothetical protein